MDSEDDFFYDTQDEIALTEKAAGRDSEDASFFLLEDLWLLSELNNGNSTECFRVFSVVAF